MIIEHFNKIMLICFLFLTVVQIRAIVFSTPTTISTPANISQFIMSKDGSKMVCVENNQTSTYFNNGSTFIKVEQNVNGSLPKLRGLSDDGTILLTYHMFLCTIQVFKLNPTSQMYEFLQNISLGCNYVAISKNNSLIIVIEYSTGTINLFVFNGTLYQPQGPNIPPIGAVSKLAISQDFQHLVSESNVGQIKFYIYNAATISYTLINYVYVYDDVNAISMSSDGLRAYVMLANFFVIYNLSSTGISSFQTVQQYNIIRVIQVSINQEISFFGLIAGITGLSSVKYFSYNATANNFSFSVVFNENASFSSLTYVNSDASIISRNTNHSYYLYSVCPDYCIECAFNGICIQCQPSHILNNGACQLPTPAIPAIPANIVQVENKTVDNKTLPCVGAQVGNVCSNYSYCSFECEECSLKPSNCTLCSNLYHDELNTGKCTPQSKIIVYFSQANRYLRIFTFRNIKSLFFYFDSLGFYSFHLHNYTRFSADVFRSIMIIKQSKGKIVQKLAPFLDVIDQKLPRYDQYSNPIYLREERKDDFFLRNELEFFIMGIPYCLCTFLAFRLIFYLIFQRSFSLYLRIFSFNGFLLQMALEGNIEQFAFLGFRNLQILFYRNYYEKIYAAGLIGVIFVIFLFTCTSYYAYLYFYGRLSKYFLDNSYRIKGSFMLMLIVYGARPLIKGVIHAALYEHNSLQLMSLAGVEFSTFLFLVYTQTLYDSFRVKTAFCFEMCHYLCYFAFDMTLLLGNFHYFSNNPNIFDLKNELAKLTIILMTAFASLRSVSLLLISAFWNNQHNEIASHNSDHNSERAHSNSERTNSNFSTLSLKPPANFCISCSKQKGIQKSGKGKSLISEIKK